MKVRTVIYKRSTNDWLQPQIQNGDRAATWTLNIAGTTWQFITSSPVFNFSLTKLYYLTERTLLHLSSSEKQFKHCLLLLSISLTLRGAKPNADSVFCCWLQPIDDGAPVVVYVTCQWLPSSFTVALWWSSSLYVQQKQRPSPSFQKTGQGYHPTQSIRNEVKYIRPHAIVGVPNTW